MAQLEKLTEGAEEVSVQVMDNSVKDLELVGNSYI